MLSKGWLIVAAGVVLGLSTAVQAATPSMAKLLAQGQYQKVYAASGARIKAGETGYQLRFYHALAAARLGWREYAIKAFQSLAKARPHAPEPHNNLAILYAQEGKYDKARTQLQAALATDKRYQTAYANLKSILAAEAAQAFNKALAPDQKHAPPRPQLSWLGPSGHAAAKPAEGAALSQPNAGENGMPAQTGSIAAQPGTVPAAPTAATTTAPPAGVPAPATSTSPAASQKSVGKSNVGTGPASPATVPAAATSEAVVPAPASSTLPVVSPKAVGNRHAAGTPGSGQPVHGKTSGKGPSAAKPGSQQTKNTGK